MAGEELLSGVSDLRVFVDEEHGCLGTLASLLEVGAFVEELQKAHKKQFSHHKQNGRPQSQSLMEEVDCVGTVTPFRDMAGEEFLSGVSDL